MSLQFALCDKASSHILSMIAAVYGVFIYSIAFSLEMWFIVTNPLYEEFEYGLVEEELFSSIPVFAFILAAIYFITVIVSLLLMLGIIIRSLMCIMTWVITVVLIFFPECGLVLYMTIYKWGIHSRNGQIELCFYIIRGIMNVFFLICVQNLMSQLKTEKAVSTYAMSYNQSSPVDGREVHDFYDGTSTTVNPVFKYTTAINGAQLSSASEFDTRHFNDSIFKKSYFEETYNSMAASATQSLDRRKFGKLKHSSSFKEEVLLRPLTHQPFDYLGRPGSIVDLRDTNLVVNGNPHHYYHNGSKTLPRDHGDHKSSTQSIRDVAL